LYPTTGKAPEKATVADIADVCFIVIKKEQ
jgi:hypothetical protein